MTDLFNAEQFKRNDVKLDKNIRLGKEDPLNRPRHRIQNSCTTFQECPLCYKCRAYDLSDLKCVNCELKDGSLCNKEKHTEKILSFMIQRERIVIR